MTALNDLIADPLFQLNSLLWLTQPLPAVSSIRPLLLERGFVVHAIGPLLPLPPDIRLALADLSIATQGSARPDAVLRRDRDMRYGLVECKGKAFGTKSSTAAQARTLVIAAGSQMAEILGLAADEVQGSVAAYWVPTQAGVEMHETLGLLHGELADAKIACGTTCVLGLEARKDAIYLVPDDVAGEFFGLGKTPLPYLFIEDDNDPRPLYFIPYDPDSCRSPGDDKYCKRILFERIQATVLGAAGRATPPAELRFQAEDLLNSAMLGSYGLWENRDSAKHMRRLVRQLLADLEKAVCTEVAGVLSYVETAGWVLRIENEASQERVCSALAKYTPEAIDLSQDPQPGLFDDAPDL